MQEPPPRSLPLIALLRGNRNIRLLWFGQLVSQFGDWFNSVAVYALLLDLTGSAVAVAAMMAVQFLPIALVGPVAGVVVDRLDRRRVMIAADIARGLVVLLLLLVRDRSTIWLAYVAVGASVAATAFFEPARTALLPRLASRDELLPANALAAATWSAMLAVGAAAGGFVTATLGRNAAFAFNSASFFVSALLIMRVRVPAAPRPVPASTSAPTPGVDAGGWADVRQALRYVRAHPRVRHLLAIKPSWSIAGAMLLLLTVFAERVFKVAGGAAAGIGVLYTARGVGAMCGSLLTNSALGSNPERLRRAIAPAFFAIAIFYGALAGSPNIWVAALAVAGAHGAGSIIFVSSTCLLQLEVPDAMRGRVFSAEMMLMTIITSSAGLFSALAVDRWGAPPRIVTLALAVLFLAPALYFAVTDLPQRAPSSPRE